MMLFIKEAFIKPAKKPCPHCGEMIQGGAIKCMYCREFIEPQKEPQVEQTRIPEPTDSRFAVHTERRGNIRRVWFEVDGVRIEGRVVLEHSVTRKEFSGDIPPWGKEPSFLKLFIDNALVGKTKVPMEEIQVSVKGKSASHMIAASFDTTNAEPIRLVVDEKLVQTDFAPKSAHNFGLKGIWMLSSIVSIRAISAALIFHDWFALCLYGLFAVAGVGLALSYTKKPKRNLYIAIVLTFLQLIDMIVWRLMVFFRSDLHSSDLEFWVAFTFIMLLVIAMINMLEALKQTALHMKEKSPSQQQNMEHSDGRLG